MGWMPRPASSMIRHSMDFASWNRKAHRRWMRSIAHPRSSARPRRAPRRTWRLAVGLSWAPASSATVADQLGGDWRPLEGLRFSSCQRASPAGPIAKDVTTSRGEWWLAVVDHADPCYLCSPVLLRWNASGIVRRRWGRKTLFHWDEAAHRWANLPAGPKDHHRRTWLSGPLVSPPPRASQGRQIRDGTDVAARYFVYKLYEYDGHRCNGRRCGAGRVSGDFWR
jgi:hypothetical protein